MNKEFIESIISEKIAESDTLEYKGIYFNNGELGSIPQKTLSKLYITICAFANYHGGRLVIGIKEDDNHNPSEVCDVGLNEENFETWEQSFRNKLAASIVPAINNVEIELVNIKDNKHCVIIKVPQSPIKPHAYSTQNKHDFYIRNGNINRFMLYNDLINSFESLNNRLQKINNFRSERISSVFSGEIEDIFMTCPLFLIHIIPETSLYESTFINLKSCEKNYDLSIFKPTDINGTNSYNADGLVKTYADHKLNQSSYIQIFYNGCIEVGQRLDECDFEQDSKYIGNLYNLEKLAAKKIYNYCLGLNKQELGNRFYISFAFLNIKNCYSEISEFNDYSKPVKKNIIKSPFIMWDMENPYPESIYQLLNNLANIFGKSESSLYENSAPKIEDFKFITIDNDK